jgi:HEAT repeat protein
VASAQALESELAGDLEIPCNRRTAGRVLALAMRAIVLFGFSLVLTALALRIDDPRSRDPARERTFDELRRDARDSKPATRRRAVRELAHAGTRDGWLLVIEALGDPESEVADAAQLALGSLGDARLVYELCGKLGLEHKDERVAVRVAEALGRSPVEIDADRLAGALAGRDVEVARALLVSIERLAAAGRLAGRIDHLVPPIARIDGARKDVELSCAALVALAELDAPNLRMLVLQALSDREPARRIAGLQAAMQMRTAQAAERLDWARKASTDADPRVRIQAVECLAGLRTRAAALALVAQLEREPRLRVRWRIVGCLQNASGLKSRLDPRPWKLWAEQLPEGSLASVAARPATTHDDVNTTTTGFATLPVISDRVCFLFDFSGSMWTPLDDGRLPKDVVALRLREALAALPEDTAFNLVPFTYDPLPWEPRLQPAKKSAVSRALEFFDTCTARGRGNFYDAALLALRDEQVDTVVALTDGVPTGGFHSDMDVIVPLLLERNRFRKVAFDSILVDARLGTARRWNELSVRTGGTCVEIELGD